MMDNNDAQKHLASLPVEREARSEEQPGQRWQGENGVCQPRSEKIRLIVLGLALFVLLASFLLFLFSGIVLPLLGA